MSRQPRKKPKLKRVNVNQRAQWREILKDVDKDDIPIDLLLLISVNLIDGTRVNIDVKELLAEGQDPREVEQLLDSRFRALDMFIKDIDFFVNVDDVVRTVQPITDQILKDL